MIAKTRRNGRSSKPDQTCLIERIVVCTRHGARGRAPGRHAHVQADTPRPLAFLSTV